MRWDELEEQNCSVSRTLSVIGDRWTMMVLRCCFMRVRRFEEFQMKLGIARRVLSERLQKLVEKGVLRKEPYQERPTRYEYRLTQKGLDLYPVIMAMVAWGDRYMVGEEGIPMRHRHLPCGHAFHAVSTCSECGETLDPRQVRLEFLLEETLFVDGQPMAARSKTGSDD